ncbi:MAG: FKBP-type peptidyl-prolyl cis-trans isomerase [Prevotella sp.]|nr:FKBP-type peptidyl-prolyl cis-trans isomerase [Prevotella sp.]
MEHRFLAVHYQLHSIKDGERTLEEQTIREKPFQFISGFGVSLDALERQVLNLEKGAEFDFTLTPDEAFGEYDPEGVHKLAREVFTVNDRFDNQHVFPGAIITLMDDEQNRFMARVMDIELDGVTVDTNHPMAGKTLNFTGEVLENRPATDDEINALIKHITSGCEGCEGDCGGDCGGGGCGGETNGKGGCGHCHG